jgi:hypothetical protein
MVVNVPLTNVCRPNAKLGTLGDISAVSASNAAAMSAIPRGTRRGRLRSDSRDGRVRIGCVSGALLDLTATDASRADQNASDAAADRGAHFLQIGAPSALGPVVGMADVVANRGLLATDRTIPHSQCSDMTLRLNILA